MIAAAMMLVQAAAGTPQSFSILADPCASVSADEVVVCGRAQQRLPPGERGTPVGPVATNPDLVPAAALTTPCAGSMSGCGVGFNIFGPAVAAVRLVQKAVNPDACCEGDQATNPFRLIGDAAKAVKGKEKVDRSGRVPIDLGAPPTVAGRVQ